MPNINDAFPSAYLKASDLKGAQPIVTIDRVEYELVGAQKERKPVLYFQHKEKGMVLNKTNANKIIQMTGSPVTEEWKGHRIMLYTAQVDFQGDTVEAIRVKAAPQPYAKPRPVAPPPPPPEPSPDVELPEEHDPFDASSITDDDIPF